MSKKKLAGDITDISEGIPELTLGDITAQTLTDGTELTEEAIATLNDAKSDDDDEAAVAKALGSFSLDDGTGKDQRPHTLPEGSGRVLVLRHKASGHFVQYNQLSAANQDFTVLRVDKALFHKLNVVA